jgi:hypothetical protein
MIDVTRERMARIFTEWERRSDSLYGVGPYDIPKLPGIGSVLANDYGRECTEYFYIIAGEMDEAGLLPR